jgi:hypothetical protein
VHRREPPRLTPRVTVYFHSHKRGVACLCTDCNFTSHSPADAQFLVPPITSLTEAPITSRPRYSLLSVNHKLFAQALGWVLGVLPNFV